MDSDISPQHGLILRSEMSNRPLLLLPLLPEPLLGALLPQRSDITP